MTKQPMALVPVEPTEEMTAQGEANNFGGDDSFYDWASDNAYRAMLTASPNAGQVSREQVEEIAEMLQRNSGFAVVSPSQLARDVVNALDLSIEGDEE